ncbi:MAG: Dyp-type peroxidase [Gammaproteobacteria bacterium]|nr:Dyp-type peroxidase [Gammaproteobacteria bacterium]MBQ0775722.1 Dyp-type peroxidase [Gammaproteobacteria bacterium]
MPSFQPAIFDKSASQHVFLEFALRRSDNADAIKAALRTLRAGLNTDIKLMVAFGQRLWSLLDSSFEMPAFSLEGRVPATQGDLLIWLQSGDRSSLYEAEMMVLDLLGAHCGVQLEIQGFVYRDSRDLTGFVDGIGNPEGKKALAAALVKEGHPGAGGSFVLTQKWIHKLHEFHQLEEAEQENVFGRTKADAVEFDDERMPANAHVGRTDIDRDGVPQKIWRRSVPYGNAREQGLYFVGFSCELDRLDHLLRNMYDMNGEGVRDRLLDFSQPVMSSWWYAPTEEWLGKL